MSEGNDPEQQSPAAGNDGEVRRDVSKRARAGVKWVLIARLSQRGLRFVSMMVLARLLVPEIFGLVSMAQLTVQLMAVLREFGLGQAWIQRHADSPEDEAVAADTTFWMMFGLNLILFATAQVAAPAIVEFFEQPALLPILRATCVLFLFDALQIVPELTLAKRLEFGKASLVEITGAFAQICTSVPLAFAGYGAWSLVLGLLVGRSVSTVTAFVMSGWTPRLRFSGQIARDLFSFGKHLWAFATLRAFGSVADRAAVGKLIGADALGAYHTAYTLSHLPIDQISGVVNRVSFPAFAKLRGDHAALRAGVSSVLTHVCAVTMPLMMGMLYLSEELVMVAFGDQWSHAVPILRVLVLHGLVLSTITLTGPVFQAVGRPDVLPKTAIVHQIVLFSGLYALSSHGAVGIAWAVVLPEVAAGTIAFVLVRRFIQMGYAELLGPILRSGSAALVMLVSLYAIDLQLPLLGNLDSLSRVAVFVPAGGVIYLIASGVLNRDGIQSVVSTARRMFGRD